MSSIQLIQYRNYADVTFLLSDWTIFVGPNGSGKTNIIEAIRTLSVTKSYRVRNDRETIQWGKDYCRVILGLDDDGFEYVLTTNEGITKKIVKRNGILIPLPDIYGLIPTVLFSPESMQLVEGSPQERRRFLDTILSQSNHEYLTALMRYRKVLRERHFILLRIQSGLGNEDELVYWDNQLVETGSAIITEREKLVESLNELIKAIYPIFLEKKDKTPLCIVYETSSKATALASQLERSRKFDIQSATTKYGPHRDELHFFLGERDMTVFASRGEMRRAVLAIKVAEAKYLKEGNKTPILLLDDVFSELDSLRRAKLHNLITGYQTIITTTDQSFVEPLISSSTVLHLLPWNP